MHEFDPSNVKRVKISEVEPSDYNPKLADTEEYKQVVESIKVNGFRQPIIVREVGDKYVCVDGHQRLKACEELGLEDIYVYDLGQISEKKAKALTIWLETKVDFNELMLAPIVVELSNLGMEIPYSKEQVEDFTAMLDFDFSEPKDDGLEEFSVKMTPDQYQVVESALEGYAEDNKISLAEALDDLTAEGIKHYGL